MDDSTSQMTELRNFESEAKRMHVGFFFRATLLATLFSQPIRANEAKRIYLNGRDISHAKHQDLQKVDLHIDGAGNVFISAPHYEVVEESSYIPLSQHHGGLDDYPQHKPATAIGKRDAPQKSKTLPPLGNNDMRPASPPAAEDENAQQDIPKGKAKIPDAVTNR